MIGLNYRIWILFLLFLPAITKAQWAALPFNTGYKNYSVSFIDKDTGYVCGGIWQGPPSGINHGLLYKTTNGGNTWITVFNDSSSTPISQVSFVTPKLGFYRRWYDNITKTTDGGVTETNVLNTGSSSSLDRFQVLDSLRYFYSRSNNVYYTSNGGVSWITKNLTPFQAFTNGDNYVQFRDLKNGFIWGNTMYFTPTLYDEFYMYKTTDSCNSLQLSFSTTQAGSGLNPSFSRMKFVDSTTAIFTLDNLVLRTNDFGTTWDTVFIGSPSILWQSMDAKKNLVLIGGNNGTILTSVDSGLTYQTATVAGANIKITDISIADAFRGIIYATCDNGHILKFKPNTASVTEYEKSGILIYPNPTVGALRLKFPDTKNENRIIYILDHTGQQLKSFNCNVSGNTSENIDISELKTGYYILKIKSNSKVDYFKILKQ